MNRAFEQFIVQGQTIAARHGLAWKMNYDRVSGKVAKDQWWDLSAAAGRTERPRQVVSTFGAPKSTHEAVQTILGRNVSTVMSETWIDFFKSIAVHDLFVNGRTPGNFTINLAESFRFLALCAGDTPPSNLSAQIVSAAYNAALTATESGKRASTLKALIASWLDGTGIADARPLAQYCVAEVRTHAIELVTSRREAAAIVPADHVERVRQALLDSDTRGDAWAGDNCDPEDIASWRSFRAAAIGTRTPQEITVAYLAGPEPHNDLEVLLELGVRPENIWAFEVDKKIAAQGLDTLRDLKARGVKFIPASIEDYFIATPRRFDIIYFDACGPFPSRSSDTARVLATLFRHSALAPLGVLVSNFARPDINKPEELARFGFLVGA